MITPDMSGLTELIALMQLVVFIAGAYIALVVFTLIAIVVTNVVDNIRWKYIARGDVP